MKVIKEETLRGLINKIIDRENNAKDEKDRFIFGVMRLQCAEIIKACQELDTLTVDRLRPMSEAPMDESIILAFNKYEKDFVKAFFIADDWCVPEFDFTPLESDFEGWLPMPRYEP